ncbi:hypothetical protein [Larkinella soli]|uniref:hypothetical protein n=1 Tax=Larkinella soli TaxID=1770527 RepID=UPI000FFB6976|nr:hypothetical protein [Larkinella soli]
MKALFGTVAGFVLVLLGIHLFGDVPVSRILQSFGVPPLAHHFNDLHVITSAARCEMPYEDILAGKCRTGYATLNYPQIWLPLTRFFNGFVPETDYTALLILIAFALVYLIVLYRFSKKAGWIPAAAFCSPVTLLAMERANSDLIIFGLLVFFVLLLHRRVSRPISRMAACALLLLAILLKLYPLAAIVTLLHRKLYPYALALSALTIGYLFLTAGDLKLISAVTPRAFDLSYGQFAVFDRFGALAIRHLPVAFGSSALHRVSAVVTALLAGVLLFLMRSYKIRWPEPGPALPPVTVDLFLTGAAVYCLTFVLGNNWDYRVIFLHLCLPYGSFLLADARLKRFGYGLAGVVLFRSWLNLLLYGTIQLPGFASKLVILLKETIDWTLFAAFLFVLFSVLLRELPLLRQSFRRE